MSNMDKYGWAIVTIALLVIFCQIVRVVAVGLI
jgi:hypothetical protein